ncbi:MAG: hypothetical protein K2X27_27615 [Candidatus Obscuribacterales bacterium]|nr:hypothetical protein [Candidatus Obscuribacterales bacterium]
MWVNKAIFKFTVMSACLDPMKLMYVALLGFVVPIGMKLAALYHGSADSQTFEMLTGKVGVSFIMMVLCLGLAGNSTTQSGRGGEYLPLLFSRPVSRTEYVFTKWVTITAIGGTLAALQNILVALCGFAFGETTSALGLLSMIIERYLDSGILAAGMIWTMLNKHPVFQVTSIIAFYVWMLGQTVPPVSVAGPQASGVDQLALEATKILLDCSGYLGDLVLPGINIYDLLNAHTPSLLPIIAYFSTLGIYLTGAIISTNKREFFYGTN